MTKHAKPGVPLQISEVERDERDARRRRTNRLHHTANRHNLCRPTSGELAVTRKQTGNARKIAFTFQTGVVEDWRSNERLPSHIRQQHVLPAYAEPPHPWQQAITDALNGIKTGEVNRLRAESCME